MLVLLITFETCFRGSRYEEWASTIHNNSELRYVVVDMTGGGFGNQLLQAIQGLIIALETRRALILYSLNTMEDAQNVGMTWHPAMAQKFSFNSTLSLIPSAKLVDLGWPDRARTYDVDLHTGQGLQFVTCSNWNTTLAPYRFAKECTVHLGEDGYVCAG